MPLSSSPDPAVSGTNGTSLELARAKAAEELSKRLSDFRVWLKEEAGCFVHPSVCIVNSEATDGTKNAPVLILGGSGAATVDAAKASDRLGSVGGFGEEFMYSKTVGCQVRTVREMKKGDCIMTIPRASMVTPDLVASSDAGRAILACCKPRTRGAEPQERHGFWDAFANTRERENQFKSKSISGLHLLVKILQERKRVETVLTNRLKMNVPPEACGDSPLCKLADWGTVSTRAPFLAFLIHQRFHHDARPKVVDKENDKEFSEDNTTPNGLTESISVVQQPDSPDTFGPYARTLPGSVLIPICWTREELALLSGCIPGRAILEDVLAQTLLLSAEFIAILEAGILDRFPKTFPAGLLTWDRWVWAASILSSRMLPSTAYFTDLDLHASTFKPSDPLEFQSPPNIWDELGVLVPLLDMLNHEIDAHQVRWQQAVSVDTATDGREAHPPRAIIERKVKKGSELFCAYGDVGNHSLVIQYGIAQINNTRDEARVGWGLSEAVGHAAVPPDFEPLLEGGDDVYESNEKKDLENWWTEERLKLLEREASLDERHLERLKQGQKLSGLAYNDGAFHPVILAACVVASMPKSEISKGFVDKIVLNQRHLISLRNLLASMFSKKLEKLLHNLDAGLKAHFSNLSLWTKASKGGLKYNPSPKDAEQGGDDKRIGWQTFFEENAYRATVEVEKNFYAVAPDSCVLALYDGHLRALQLSIDSVSNDDTFKNDVAQQLRDLGYALNESPDAENDAGADSAGSDNKPASISGGKEDVAAGGEKKNSPGRRRRNRKKGKDGGSAYPNAEKPPALKLHVGNLAYSTTPSDLYDFFSSVYGKDNILECHIPVERESGRSRGFGFVTMPESVAVTALTPGKKHEIAGRLLKVARSNSAGTTDSGRAATGSVGTSKDRCVTCGYRPRYCICSVPNLPPAGPSPSYRNGNASDGSLLPDPGWRKDGLPPLDRYGGGGGRNREERYGGMRGYERVGHGGGYDSFGGRSFDRDRVYVYGRDLQRDRPSASRGYHSDYDRDDRHWGRKRYRDLSYSRSPSPRRWIDNDDNKGSRRESHRDYDRKRSPSPRSRSGSPERTRKKTRKRES